MAWGILDDPKMANVPGTTMLSDLTLDLSVTDATKHLKHRDGVLLVPQPSNSPNDPLNWSVTRKNVIILLLAIALTTTFSASGSISVALKWIVADYHGDYAGTVRELMLPKVAASTVAFFFASATSAVYGKRVQFVICGFAFVFIQLAGYWENSIRYLQIIGVFQGIFAAPIEMLLGAVVTDMFFVHERAQKLAWMGALESIGGEIGSVISSQIIDHSRKHGIHKAFLTSACVMFPIMLLVYFFCPETTYNKRQIQLEHDFQHHDIIPEKLDQSSSTVFVQDKESKDVQITQRTLSEGSDVPEGPSEPRDPWSYRLKIFHGRLTDRSFFKAIVQPFPLMIFPAVMFSTVVYGAYGTWSIYSAYIIYQALVEPPYDFSPGKLGLINIPGPFVSLIFSLVAGYFCDWLIRFMARRNKGIYEPEYRLLMMIPAVILSTVAFMGQGYIMNESAKWKALQTKAFIDMTRKVPNPTPYPAPFPIKSHLIKLILFSMCHYAAGPFAASAALTYILDCHQKNATEAFVGTTLLKSIMAMSAVFSANMWYVKSGPKKVFTTLAIVNASVVALTIPMYIFGKRFRAMVARSKLMTKASKVA